MQHKNMSVLIVPALQIGPFLLCWDFNWKDLDAC